MHQLIDLDAERTVLGAAILNRQARELLAQLDPEVFYHPGHARLARALTSPAGAAVHDTYELADSGVAHRIVGLDAALRATGGEPGDVVLAHAAIEPAPVIPLAPRAARILERLAAARALHRSASDTLEQLDRWPHVEWEAIGHVYADALHLLETSSA